MIHRYAGPTCVDGVACRTLAEWSAVGRGGTLGDWRMIGIANQGRMR
jgi:hypothetical protein